MSASERNGALEIVVNGESRRVRPGTTVDALLRDHELDPDVVVVERNGSILARARFPETPLEAGDEIEIVHFVGGG